MEEKLSDVLVVERVPRLVDIGTRAVYKLAYKKQLIASGAYLDSLGDPNIAHTSVAVPVRCAFYLEVRDSDDGAAVLVRSGTMIVGGETIGIGMEKKNIPSGTLLQVGDVKMQFQISNLNIGTTNNTRRLLPRTPQESYEPPSELSLISGDAAGSTEKLTQSADDHEEAHVDEALRAELKRITNEIYARKEADRRPPPPYEQVANSIGYQLLLHSRKSITAAFIQSFYGLLKKLELLEPSIVTMYREYVKLYEEARGAGPTPHCMHPADVPTVQFLVQLIFHMCSHPALSEAASSSGSKWMQLLAIFSESPQNRAPLVQCKAWSYLLSTMKLTVMSNREPFQRYGWTTLTNLIHTPAVDGKPVITEQVMMLALDIAVIQLQKSVENVQLATAVVRFLSVLATKATRAMVKKGTHKGRVFTAEQAAHVLQMMHTCEVLRHVMALPQGHRGHEDFHRVYRALIVAMAPVVKDANLKGASAGPSHRRARMTTPPMIVQLVKVRVGPPSQEDTPPPLPPRPSSLPGQRLSNMQMSASLYSISSHAETKRRKLPAIPGSKRSASLKHMGRGGGDRRAKSLGQDDIMELLKLPQEAVPPKPPRSPQRKKADTIPTSSSEFNILFISHEEPPPQHHQLGLSLDSQGIRALQKAASVDMHPSNAPNLLPPGGSGSGVTLRGDTLVSEGNPKGVAVQQPAATPLFPPARDPPGPLPQWVVEPPSSSSRGAEVEAEGKPPPPLPAAAAQVPRPTRRFSADDPLNAEVSRLLLDLTVCPEVLTSSVSSAHSSPPRGPELGVGTVSRDLKASGSLDGTGSSEMIPAVGSGDSPVVLRHKKAGEQVVVPKTSLNYFRQSVKRKKGGVASQGSHAQSLPEEVPQQQQQQGGGGGEGVGGEFPWRGNRRSWSQNSHLTQLPGKDDDPSQLFEMSGVHLSSESAALEGIVAEHGDIIEALEGRLEVLDKIQGLWYGDKGLQAATNAVMACFSEDNDVSLFTDVLQLFSSFTPPWSLSVCLVVLPTLEQLLVSLREPHHLSVVCDAIQWIVEHFSDLILTYRNPQRSQRLQAMEDREKKLMCYRQLHQMSQALQKRLVSVNDPTDASQSLAALLTQLQPFSEQEIVTSPPP